MSLLEPIATVARLCLVQMGYKHRLRMGLRDPDIYDLPPSLLNCMRATLCAGGVNVQMY
jgi:hypothetical protein